MTEQQTQRLITDLKLILKRLGELNLGDEESARYAGVRTSLGHVIEYVEGKVP